MNNDTTLTHKKSNYSALVPPVNIGYIITAKPKGKAKNDYFIDLNGFIVFIKEMPEQYSNEIVRVRVTAVKKSFAFAVFEGLA